MEISLQVSFWICLLFLEINAHVRSNNEPHNPMSGAGYLEAQLILKLFSNMEKDIKDLRDELEDLKAKPVTGNILYFNINEFFVIVNFTAYVCFEPTKLRQYLRSLFLCAFNFTCPHV